MSLHSVNEHIGDRGDRWFVADHTLSFVRYSDGYLLRVGYIDQHLQSCNLPGSQLPQKLLCVATSLDLTNLPPIDFIQLKVC